MSRWFRCLSAAVLLLPLAARATAEPPPADPAPAVLDTEAQRIAAIEKAKAAVLAIFAPGGQGGGSGVVISPDGYALTNFHVVAGCGKAMQCGMADGKLYDAVIVGIDPTGDAAVIKLFGRKDFPTAEMGDADAVRPGDWVFAMGNPFLLATDLQPTVTYGIVSGVHRYQPPSGTFLEYADCIQTDASINPGNSGGPLFDAQARLIGINGRGSFQKRGRVNVGVGYAISINQIKRFLGALRGGRIVDHASLGVQVWADDSGRVLVKEILESSDAFRRGLRLDDEVVALDGRAISTPNGFLNVLGALPKSWRVPLSYRHDGKRYDVLVRLSGVHGEAELLDLLAAHPPVEPGPPPKPDKKPPPGRGKNEKPRQPPQPRPVPGPPHMPPRIGRDAPMPEIVKQHYEERRGFANYYFNALCQERVWKAWNAASGLHAERGPWTLSGTLERGSEFRLELSDSNASLKTSMAEYQWTAGEELGRSLLPPHSGGLLPALYLWRRLATEGLGRFGGLYYAGTAPLWGRPGLADVLVGSHKGVDCRFYFDAAEGQLLAMEMFADENSDPCEIYFADFRSIDGHMLPGRMVVRFGDDPYAAMEIKAFKSEKKPENKERKKDERGNEKKPDQGGKRGK
jgi:S1-C subfamily serine protease